MCVCKYRYPEFKCIFSLEIELRGNTSFLYLLQFTESEVESNYYLN